MKLSLSATPEELLCKGNSIVSALAKAVIAYNPELADSLYEAVIVPEMDFKYQVLSDISKNVQAKYRKYNAAMLSAIFKVIVGALTNSIEVEKSEGTALNSDHLNKFYDITMPIVQAENDIYERIKHVMLAMGYSAKDFEKEGKLYGKSVNDLLAVLQVDNKKGNHG